MEQEKFIENINALKEYAKSVGNKVTMEDIRREFADMGLEQEQLDMIMEYFRQAKEEEAETAALPQEKLEQLAKEDRRFLKECARDLQECYGCGKFLSEMSGEEKAQFAENFDIETDSGVSSMLLALDIAMQYQGKGVALADLVQEGNLCALETGYSMVGQGTGKIAYERICAAVRERIDAMVQAQLQITGDEQKTLAKVNRLQATADRLCEELGRKVTLAELAGELGWSGEEVSALSGYTDDSLKNVVYEGK